MTRGILSEKPAYKKWSKERVSEFLKLYADQTNTYDDIADQMGISIHQVEWAAKSFANRHRRQRDKDSGNHLPLPVDAVINDD